MPGLDGHLWIVGPSENTIIIIKSQQELDQYRNHLTYFLGAGMAESTPWRVVVGGAGVVCREEPACDHKHVRV